MSMHSKLIVANYEHSRIKSVDSDLMELHKTAESPQLASGPYDKQNHDKNRSLLLRFQFQAAKASKASMMYDEALITTSKSRALSLPYSALFIVKLQYSR